MQLYRLLPTERTKTAGGNTLTGSPSLYICEEAWAKLRCYAAAMEHNEINGFAHIQRLGGEFYITDADSVFITMQTVSPALAVVDPTIFAKALDSALVAGRNPDSLRVQWHSHGHSSVYFSETDLNTIESYGNAGMEWFVSLVINVSGHARARFDQYRPMRLGLEIPVIVYDMIPEHLERSCRAEIAQLVTVMEPPEVQPDEFEDTQRPRRGRRLGRTSRRQSPLTEVSS